MRRQAPIPGWVFMTGVWALAVGSLAACAVPSSPAPPAAQPTLTRATSTARPTVRPSLSPTPRLVPSATKTATPSATPTLDVIWSEPAVELHPWLNYFYRVDWSSAHELLVLGDKQLRIQVEGERASVAELTPEPTDAVPATRVSSSWDGRLALDCQAGALWLTDQTTSQILRRMGTEAFICDDEYSPLTLAPDEAAVAFTDSQGGVWIWELQQDAPHQVATTAFVTWPVKWSPDGRDLLVADRAAGTADSFTYVIAHRDGRPPDSTMAKLSTRSESAPTWYSDTVVSHYSECAAGCTMYAFYAAETGEFLTLYGGDIVQPGGINGGTSPDKRWLFSSTGRGEEPYQLYDFLSFHSVILHPEPTLGYQLVGWAADSRHAYVIQRSGVDVPWLLDDRAPGALLALDPLTRTFTPLTSGVVYASLSDEADRLWIVTVDDEDKLWAGIYDAHGRPLTPLRDIGRLSTLATLEETHPWLMALNGPYWVSWSPSDTQVVFADWQGALTQMEADGHLRQLTAQWLAPDHIWDLQVSWASDEHALLATSQDRGWLVQLAPQSP